MKNSFNAQRARPWFHAAKCEQCGRELTVFERGMRWERRDPLLDSATPEHGYRRGLATVWLCSDHTPRDPDKALAKVARIERKRLRVEPPKAGTAAIPPAPSVVIIRNETACTAPSAATLIVGKPGPVVIRDAVGTPVAEVRAPQQSSER